MKMTYYVYKAKPRGNHWPHNWEIHSEHESISDAEQAATSLCPSGTELYTEPGRGLDRGFFGSASGNRWSAMITTKPIDLDA